MSEFFSKLYSSEQIREIEKYIFTKLGFDEFELMFRAGKYAFEVIKDQIINKNVKIKIFCGVGNNGGDGFILAGFLKKDGYDVEIFEIGNFLKQSKLASKAKDLAIECDVKINKYDEAVILNEDDVIIDAIYGIGINCNIKLEQRKIIDKINNSNAFIIGLDCPSGLNPDNGQIMGNCVRCDITISFLQLKLGCFLNFGPKFCGEIFVNNLAVNYEDFLAKITPSFITIFDKDLLKIIPPRKLDANKGDFGNILAIGGDHSMAGAIMMAAEACCRSGAGKVTVLTRQENIEALNVRLPNVMSAIYDDKKDLELAIKNKDFLIIGPGLGNSKWSSDLFEFFMDNNLAKLIDADGLNLLAKSDKKYDLKNAIITPHPKEAANLLGITTKEVQKNRQETARKLHEKYGCIVVLKGANSIIYDGNNFCLCGHSNPAMAVAGMGDILSGLIAGFTFQNISLFEAAIIGSFIHVISANLLVEEHGEIGLLPNDIVENLPFVYSYLRKN